MKIWLVWRNTPWQGDTLINSYLDAATAEARANLGRIQDNEIVQSGDISRWSVEEITIGEETDSWHGN